MIIIRLISGLGNQMFQYAFFLQMQQWYGKENVKLDIDTYHWKEHNGRELDKVFHIDLKKDAAPLSLSLSMADVGYRLKDRVLRRLRGEKHRCYAFWKNLTYDDYGCLPKDIYLEGYWTEDRYFCNVAEKIRSIYQFSEPSDDRNRKYLSQIRNYSSVGIHVRRGDYLLYPDLFPMCSVEYYQNAINYITTAYPKQDFIFFVFSDAIDWCKNNLAFLKKVQFINHNVKTDSYKDMMLLAACKHQIIANSTFSWWAAWLNSNPNKIVLYPSTTRLTYESMPKSWICIDV